MRNAKNPKTGQPVFTLGVAFSLMMFYAFAMQCASTVAVVYRETKDWRWPAAQFAYMTYQCWLMTPRLFLNKLLIYHLGTFGS
jgi:ferrous iron transport protein B